MGVYAPSMFLILLSVEKNEIFRRERQRSTAIRWSPDRDYGVP